MLLRILSESFIRRRRRKILGILAITLGSSLATALIGISIEVGDRMRSELKVYGANIRLVPKDLGRTAAWGPVARGAALDERELVKLKEIFWANNIVGFAPVLSTWAQFQGVNIPVRGTWFRKVLAISGGTWETGARVLFPFWKIDGSWPSPGTAEALAGREIALRLGMNKGDILRLEQDHRVVQVRITGVLTSGEDYDRALVLDLEDAQTLADARHAVSEVFVSALTNPEDDLERLYRRNPNALNPVEYERWYCTPYIDTVSRELQEAIAGSAAHPILEVAQREGAMLEKLRSLFIFICAAALLTAGFGVTSVLMATVAERRKEVGLLMALGAGPGNIMLIFLAELAVMAFAGSVLGGALGYGIGQFISLRLFNVPVHINPVVLFVVAVVTMAISLIGGLFPIRSALRLEPVRVLHEA